MEIKKPSLTPIRKTETVRQRAEKIQKKKISEPRRKKVTTAASKPIRGFGSILKKEFNPIKLPDNKYGRILKKRFSLMPSYFVESFNELRSVKWPSKRQAASLTFAVIVFSISIALFVQALGYGFDKLFKEVILK